MEGVSKPQLTLLTDISGAFRPGVLTCLMGVSGAGKTTLLDLLAGRKTGARADCVVLRCMFDTVQQPCVEKAIVAARGCSPAARPVSAAPAVVLQCACKI